MNVWPFITILASLILILFFRRIDKRTINFNKFRKYAEKLSSDFDTFLKHKKEEFSNSLIDLDIAIKKASQLLTRITLSGENLKASYTNIEKEKKFLENLKKELEKLKNLKEEVANEVDSIGKSLPSLKKLGQRVQKISIGIVENEKALKNASLFIPSIEKRVNEKAKKAIDDITEKIFDDAKDMFSPLIDEYRDSLELLRSAGKDELERFKKDTQTVMDVVNQKVKDLNGSIEQGKNKLSIMERESIFPIEDKISALNESLREAMEKVEYIERETAKSFLKMAEGEYKNFVKLLEKSHLEHQNTVFQKIEEKSKDLSSYIAKLEGRVFNLLKDIKLETDKYAETLNLKARANESEVDLLKNKVISEINEETNKNLLQIKPLVSEMNEKLLIYRKDFNAILEDVRNEYSSKKIEINSEISSFKNEIENYKNNLVGELVNRAQDTKSLLETINNRLKDEIENATRLVGSEFIEKLKIYKEEISMLEGRIGDLENIASAGQKLIEDRIDKVFQNYKPEIEEKISSMQEETEDIVSKENEKIVKKINEVINSARSDLEEKEKNVKDLIEEINKTISRSEENLKKEESELLDSMNNVKLEAREELLRELENLRAIFKDEKQRVIDKYDKNLSRLKDSMKTIDYKIENIREVIDEKIKDAVDSAIGNIKAIETNYLKTEDEVIKNAKNNLDFLAKEIDMIKANVENLKKEVLDDIDNTLSDFRKDFDNELKMHSNNLKGKEKEVYDLLNTITEKTQQEMEKSKNEAEGILKGFEEDVASLQEKIEKRIKDIEKRISEFEKESSIIKRASRFKERVEGDIEKFSDLIYQLKEDKKDIMSFKKVIQSLKRDEGDISARVRQLKGDKKVVNDIAKNAEQAIGLIAVVDEKIRFIETEKDVLIKMDEEIKGFGERFKELEAKVNILTGKEGDIDVSIETIAKTKDFITNLEKRTEILKESFTEIKDIEGDIKSRISLVDEKTRILMGNERKIDDVLDRFKEMDSLVIDIEARTKQLKNAREWLAQTESRLTNLLANAERLTKELDENKEKFGSYTSTGLKGTLQGEKAGKSSRESNNKVKTVLTLFDQKWTIPEICKVTRMSRGEVELILELNNR